MIADRSGHSDCVRSSPWSGVPPFSAAKFPPHRQRRTENHPCQAAHSPVLLCTRQQPRALSKRVKSERDERARSQTVANKREEKSSLVLPLTAFHCATGCSNLQHRNVEVLVQGATASARPDHALLCLCAGRLAEAIGDALLRDGSVCRCASPGAQVDAKRLVLAQALRALPCPALLACRRRLSTNSPSRFASRGPARRGRRGICCKTTRTIPGP